MTTNRKREVRLLGAIITFGIIAVMGAVVYAALIHGRMAREEGAESIRAEARRRSVAEANAYKADTMAFLKRWRDERDRQDEESRKRSGR